MNMTTHEEFLRKLHNINSTLIPLEKYRGIHTKIKFQCKKKHIFECEPNNILIRNNGCPICSNHQVLKGYNDMWETNAAMANLLQNPDDGYKYTQNSTHKLNWVCPDCGNVIYNKSPNTVYRQGLGCKNCGDGISYPEKYIISLLNQLGIEYQHDISLEWSNKKRYDFYIPKYNMIIETHGLQHYEERFDFANHKRKNQRTLSEEIQNDIYKKQLALKNNIAYYIQLDCRESQSQYIQQSIFDSELSKIFILSTVDWNKCALDSTKSIIYQVADAWNNNIHDIQKLCDMFHVYNGTIRDYLRKATKLGLCDYNEQIFRKEGFKKAALSRCKAVRCVETGKIYNSISETELDGFSSKHISSVCKGVRTTTGGYHWEYVV